MMVFHLEMSLHIDVFSVERSVTGGALERMLTDEVSNFCLFPIMPGAEYRA